MTGDIDEPVEGEQDCRDEAGKPIPLVGAFAQRINFSNEENESDDNKNDREPTKLGPKPEPIALWVNRAPVAVGSCAKNGKDIFKITKTSAAPQRIQRLRSLRMSSWPQARITIAVRPKRFPV